MAVRRVGIVVKVRGKRVLPCREGVDGIMKLRRSMQPKLPTLCLTGLLRVELRFKVEKVYFDCRQRLFPLYPIHNPDPTKKRYMAYPRRLAQSHPTSIPQQRHHLSRSRFCCQRFIHSWQLITTVQRPRSTPYSVLRP